MRGVEVTGASAVTSQLLSSMMIGGGTRAVLSTGTVMVVVGELGCTFSAARICADKDTVNKIASP